MSLPPETLRIKRKATEPPVETLSLQAARSSKRVFSEYTFRRRKQEDHAPPSTPHRNKTGSSGVAEIAVIGEAGQKEVNSSVTKPTDQPKIETSVEALTNNNSEFRRFHLSKASSFPSKSPDDLYNSPHSGHVPEGLVFMEDIEYTSRAEERQGTQSSDIHGSLVRESPSRLGPKSSGPSAAKFSPMDMKIYEDMVARETGFATEGFGAADGNTLDGNVAMLDNDGEWVYDTYYRQSNFTPAAADAIAASSAGGAHGLLVIEEEDEDIFFLYDDDEDEYDWDTEQDDENAENFYGNDYPDADVWSDFDEEDDNDSNPYGSDDG